MPRMRSMLNLKRPQRGSVQYVLSTQNKLKIQIFLWNWPWSYKDLCFIFHVKFKACLTYTDSYRGGNINGVYNLVVFISMLKTKFERTWFLTFYNTVKGRFTKARSSINLFKIVKLHLGNRRYNIYSQLWLFSLRDTRKK